MHADPGFWFLQWQRSGSEMCCAAVGGVEVSRGSDLTACLLDVVSCVHTISLLVQLQGGYSSSSSRHWAAAADTLSCLLLFVLLLLPQASSLATTASVPWPPPKT
jgi:hypothetical protein